MGYVGSSSTAFAGVRYYNGNAHCCHLVLSLVQDLLAAK